ncbi:MAG: hypothetical protein WB689_11925 [Xanthobacteraceae bacterium]
MSCSTLTQWISAWSRTGGAFFSMKIELPASQEEEEEEEEKRKKKRKLGIPRRKWVSNTRAQGAERHGANKEK